MDRGKSCPKKVVKDTKEHKDDVKYWVAPTIRKGKASPDRISQLPDEILLQILSLLLPRDRMVTRILSKTWNSLSPAGWYFDSSSIEYDNETLSSKDIEGHISKSLRAYSSNDLTFRTCALSVRLVHFQRCSIDTLMKPIVEGNFHALHLRYEGHYWQPYLFRTSIFSSTCLSALSLYGCELKLDALYRVNFKFNCLRELRLEKVKLSENSLASFFHMCKNIVNLRLKQCRHVDSFDTRALEFLEKVEIWDCPLSKKISIDSPHLHTLIIRVTLGTVPDIDLKFPGKLETLILDTYFFPNLNFEYFFSDLTKLKKLQLSGCLNMKKIEISSLESLECHGEKWIQVVIGTLNLQYFKAIDEDFTQLTILMNTSSHLQKKIRLDFDRNSVIDAIWLLKLRAFVQNLSHDTTLSLHLAGVVSLKLEELAEISVLPVCYPRKLKLKSLSCLLSMHSEVLMNAILWSGRPEKLSIQFNSGPSDFVKELQNYLKFDKEALINCCESTPTKCWRHYSQNVEIEVFTWTSKKCPFHDQLKFRIKFQWSSGGSRILDENVRKPTTNKQGMR